MIQSIPHPDEPASSLPSFVSDVEVVDDGAEIWFDIADAEAHEGLLDVVEEAVVSTLGRSLASGRVLVPQQQSDPQVPQEVRAQWDDRGMPVGWPRSFPLPVGLSMRGSGVMNGEWSAEFVSVERRADELANALLADLPEAGFAIYACGAGVNEGRATVSILCSEARLQVLIRDWDVDTVVRVESLDDKKAAELRELLPRRPLPPGFAWRVPPPASR